MRNTREGERDEQKPKIPDTYKNLQKQGLRYYHIKEENDISLPTILENPRDLPLIGSNFR